MHHREISNVVKTGVSNNDGSALPSTQEFAVQIPVHFDLSTVRHVVGRAQRGPNWSCSASNHVIGHAQRSPSLVRRVATVGHAQRGMVACLGGDLLCPLILFTSTSMIFARKSAKTGEARILDSLPCF